MTPSRIERSLWILALLAGLPAAAYLGLQPRRSGADGPGGEGPAAAPVARVKVVPIAEGTINVTVTAFGTVEADRAGTRIFSLPFEALVGRVFVTAGQQVEAGEALVELAPSPEGRLQFEQAARQRRTAEKQRDLVSRRFQMKLATEQDLLEAEQNQAAADLLLRSLETRGLPKGRTIVTDARGIVSSVDVRQGEIVPAGAPLVEMISQARLVVRLGLEREEADRVRAGQAVRIEPVNGDVRTFEGRIMRLAREIDVATRLVESYVAMKDGGSLFLNEYVRGVIVTASPAGLIVPAEAVLPLDGGHILYTVEAGYAVKREVEIGPESDGRIMVSGPGLTVGRPVVTVGASQLEDNMAVEIEEAS